MAQCANKKTIGYQRMNNTFYLQKRVLVTGGAGFIGSHLVDQLVKQGACISVLDDLSTGAMENIKNVVNDIVFIHGDITSFQTCLAATQNQSIIFHLAAITSVPESVTQPRICFNTNIKGTYNMLEATRINHGERFIFSSSAAVYGNHEGICSEEKNCNPQSPYGISKLIGEQLCNHYYQLFNLHSRCLRYFNVYNPRPKITGAGVYAAFKTALLTNQPLTIFGDGTQTRDFTNVDEIVKANTIIAQLPPQYLNSQPVNIASGESISLNMLIAQLKNACCPDSQSPVLFKPARNGDIKHSAANIEQYKKLQTLLS